jgi:hypothetical protein
MLPTVHDLAVLVATLAVFALGAIPLALIGFLGSRRRR